MRVLLVISLSAMMALCAVAEDRNTIKEEFLSLSLEQQVARLRALLVRGFLDDKLKEFLEKNLKDIILNGSTDWGIPPLDPLHQEHLDVELKEDAILLNATIDQLSVTGLSNYAVELAKFDLVKQNVSFGLFFHEVNVLAEYYWMNGTVLNMVPLFGNGSVDVSVTNLSIGGDLIIGINGSYVNLKDVNMDIGIGGIKMNITGLLGGGELSELINEIINGSASELWGELKPEIMPEINNIIKKLGNEAMSGLTLQDIIDMITGNNKIYDNISTS